MIRSALALARNAVLALPICAALSAVAGAQGSSDWSAVSDDFDRCDGIGAHWTYYDPLGDAPAPYVQGAGTQDAQLVMSVPAGASHEAWNTIEAPHLVQSVDDVDFGLEVKFDSLVGPSYQIQGVLVKQDALRWLRFDFYRAGKNVYLYAGTTTAGQTTALGNFKLGNFASPLWLGVQRVGDQWTVRWSSNGASWTTVLSSVTQALVVTEAGVFVGNAVGSSSPAHTMLVDYFLDTSEPLLDEDGGFVLDASASGSGQVLVDPAQPAYGCGDVVTLTAVPAAGWVFQSWSGDLAGSANPAQLAMGADRVVVGTFVPDSGGPPVLSQLEVQPGNTTALVTWTTDVPATSLVEYGPNAGYGSSVSDGALVTSHALTLTGLTPGATYHFQACSANAGQNTACSGDGTFATLPASGLASDDFNDCAGPGAPWTFLDPLGDATVGVTGVGTDDAWLQLGVPAGSDHYPLGTFLPARLVQPVQDVDFRYEVRFDALPSAPTQLSGTTVEQGAQDWLAFAVVRDAVGLAAWVASTSGGTTSTVASVPLAASAPVVLRVTRAGDDWTFEWSDDGLSWNVAATLFRPLVAGQVGLFAGNGGQSGAPAHVASVDWFQDAAQPLATEDGPFAGSGPFTLSVTTVGGGSVARTPDQPTYTCSDVVTLTATADAGWSFDHWTGDLGGTASTEHLAMTGDRAVTAVFVSDPVPPTISNVVVTPTADGARFTWDTDIPADSRVDYGPDAGYGSMVSDATLVLSHALQVTGLPSETTWHFTLSSAEASGLWSATPDGVFQTTAAGALLSDDFNRCDGIGGHWTYYDPLGDAAPPSVQGVGTGSAQLVMSVPAGSSHEPWGTLDAPHLVQAVQDTDFGVEVKFESQLASSYQMQGVLVKQDADRWMRFDFYRSGSRVRLYVGSNQNGTTSRIGDFNLGKLNAPMWLGVERVGDQWWVRWSGDGAQWNTVVAGVTSVLAVQEVGVFVGNAVGASAPAHTMLVDYFFDSAAPLANEDQSWSGGGPFTLATFAQPAGSGSVTRSPDQPDYACGEAVTLTAVPAAGFQFDVWSGDRSGTQNPLVVTLDGDLAVTAHFVPIVDGPPQISNLAVTTTATTATVTWTTDEPATSRVDYGLTQAYTDLVVDPTLVLDHVVTLTGLPSGTLHHFRVTSADAGGQSSSSADQTFTTAGVGTLLSDDFRQPNLDLATWQWVDPLAGDGKLPEEHAQLRLTGSGTSDARLEIELPAGASYVPWLQNGAARIVQAVDDADFTVELKFETVLGQKGQSVGFFAEEDADTWLRFDFYHDGKKLWAVHSGFDAGSSFGFQQSLVQSGTWNGAPLWMRVARTGSTWTQTWSFDGTNFVAAGNALSFGAAITGVGVMAGNDSPGYPALLGVVDYVFDAASPLVPEDGAVPPDALPPLLYAAAARGASDSAVRVQWGTDEATTATIAWGLAPGAYTLGSTSGDPLTWFGDALVTGLAPDTTYHFQVQVVDATGGLVSVSPDLPATTLPSGQDGLPVIDVWYGVTDAYGDSVQRLGVHGTGQRWANVLGNVHDDNGTVVALSYTVNGGAPQPLSIGQGGFTPPYRLVGAGDFNAEIDVALLHDDSVGPNEVWITATDDDGLSTSRRVWIDYDADSVWPASYSVDWSTVTDVQDVAQVVDGVFEVDPDSGPFGTPALRTSRNDVGVPGYDRLFLVGDSSWVDYEFEFTVTVHELNPLGYYPISASHAIGLVTRWPGHSGGTQQPRELFFPFGGLFAFRWYDPGVLERWNAYGTGYHPLLYWDNGYLPVEVGVPYVFKGQVETLPSGDTVHRLKTWELGTQEPAGWFGEMVTAAGNGTTSGSLLFVVHEVDASIGNITVTPLP